MKTAQSTLIQQLTDATRSFREQYIEKSKEFAGNEWESLTRINRMNREERENERIEQGMSKYKWESFIWNRVYSIGRISKGAYQDKAVIKADEHFSYTIQKLAYRIIEKGLNLDNELKIEYVHVGENFDATITDGEKTIRAWTILAWGPVQRPHYRYLVK